MCVRGDGAFLCLAINRGTASPQTPQEKPFSSSSLFIITRYCTSVPLRRLKPITQKHFANDILLTVRKNWISSSASPPSAMTARFLLASSRSHTHTANPQPCRATAAHRSSSAHTTTRCSAKRACARTAVPPGTDAREQSCQVGL